MQHFLGDPDSVKLNLETHRLALAIAKRHWMKTDLQLLKRLWQETNQIFELEIMCTLRINNLKNGISNGDLDTGLSTLSVMDTSST